MTEHEKAWIDNATYEQLATKLHHEPINSPWLRGDTGEYFMERYHHAKSLVTSAERVRIAKKIWRKKK